MILSHFSLRQKLGLIVNVDNIYKANEGLRASTLWLHICTLYLTALVQNAVTLLNVLDNKKSI